MQVSLKNINKNFDRIPISNFWSEDGGRELKMHRIHMYPAKFPSLLVSRSIEYSKRQRKEVKTIADIFCGCGTTALEARINDINFWGCDINPVATLIARTKSRAYDEKKVDDYYAAICNSIQLLQNKKTIFNTDINDRIKYWFDDKRIIDLQILLRAIEANVHNHIYKDFFFCAFSNILKGCSRWLTKSIKPQIDPHKIVLDVFESFDRQVSFMKQASEEISKYKSDQNSKITTANFLKLKFRMPFVDMLVTSPPYATSYEYADLHQLSALWLGFTRDYRELREGTIGSLYKHTISEADVESMNEVGKKIHRDLSKVHPSKARSVTRYFIDIDKAVKNASKIVKQNGTVVFVIGNTKYANVPVNNAKYLMHSLLINGFESVKIYKRKVSSKILTPYRNKKGKFSSNPRHRRVYGHEFVVIATRK